MARNLSRGILDGLLRARGNPVRKKRWVHMRNDLMKLELAPLTFPQKTVVVESKIIPAATHATYGDVLPAYIVNESRIATRRVLWPGRHFSSWLMAVFQVASRQVRRDCVHELWQLGVQRIAKRGPIKVFQDALSSLEGRLEGFVCVFPDGRIDMLNSTLDEIGHVIRLAWRRMVLVQEAAARSSFEGADKTCIEELRTHLRVLQQQ
eukprot:6459408-Amphidinium_carterae.1